MQLQSMVLCTKDGFLSILGVKGRPVTTSLMAYQVLNGNKEFLETNPCVVLVRAPHGTIYIFTYFASTGGYVGICVYAYLQRLHWYYIPSFSSDYTFSPGQVGVSSVTLTQSRHTTANTLQSRTILEKPGPCWTQWPPGVDPFSYGLSQWACGMP